MESNNMDMLFTMHSENSVEEKQQPPHPESFLLNASKDFPLIDALKWFGHGSESAAELLFSQSNRMPLTRQKTKIRTLTADEWQKTLDHQMIRGGHIAEILVELGLFQEEDITQELTTRYGFPYLPLSNYEIDKETISLIPYKVAHEYCLIPIDRINNILSIVMANPLNLRAIKIVETITESTIHTFVAPASDIKKTIKKYYQPPEKQ